MGRLWARGFPQPAVSGKAQELEGRAEGSGWDKVGTGEQSQCLSLLWDLGWALRPFLCGAGRD